MDTIYYASVTDVAGGFRELTEAEIVRCDSLLKEAALLVDCCNRDAPEEIKQLVSCRMVRRVLGDGSDAAALYPMGASQGTASALGYSQSWTMSGGSAGELYLSKTEKKLLGAGNRIGACSPLEVLCDAEGN